ncbi:MAG: nucleotide exchange factor GrpE [Cyclobacteriaceae bacterium]
MAKKNKKKAKDNGQAEVLEKEQKVAENTEGNSGEGEKEETQEEVSLEAEIEEQKDKYLRLYSEFDNFRRRTAKEKLDLVSTANESLVVDLLPVVDDFERAIKASEDKQDSATAKEGLDLVYQKFIKILEQKGVKPIGTKPGDDFDDEQHEAITQIPAPEEKLKGKIVDVVEKGYTLNEKVVRFAKVVTGS